MMASAAPSPSGYEHRRAALETYFDRTAVDAWEKLTSDAPVSGIRATVRAGRDAMRNTLLSWLPADLRGLRLLDAGCGTGALAVEAARRGASVVAVDVSPKLISIAQDRAPAGLGIEWHVGDMLSPAYGAFHHVVAMDSLIHYAPADVIAAVEGLRARSPSVHFTFAPRTPLLMAMQAAGKLFPRRDRSPAIVPVAEKQLRGHFGNMVGRTQRIDASFYKSQAMEVFAA
jgi:magnesium-protoporphyrin O-methyltransferase